MRKNRREDFRIPCLDILANLKIGETSISTKVTDVSKGGAGTYNRIQESKEVMIEFVNERLSKTPVIPLRSGKIISHKNNGTSGIKFKRKLTHDELALLTGSATLQSKLWELVIADKCEINEEIRAIQSCRSNVFSGTIFAIAVSFITLGCFALERKLAGPAVLLGLFLTFSLFLIGILAMIEKARAINLRKGLLVVLSEFLSNGEIPESYKGWGQLRICFTECGARRRVMGCVRKVLHPAMKQSCRDKGEEDAKTLVAAKYLFSGLNDSFTSFCACIYSAIYIFVIVGFAYSIKPLVDTWWPLSFGWRLFIMAGTAVMAPILRKNTKFLIASGIGFVIASLIAINIDDSWKGIFILCISGFVLGLLGWHLINQMNTIRRGKHSVETYIYTWKRMIAKCYPVPPNPQKLKAYESTNYIKKTLTNLYQYLLK